MGSPQRKKKRVVNEYLSPVISLTDFIRPGSIANRTREAGLGIDRITESARTHLLFSLSKTLISAIHGVCLFRASEQLVRPHRYWDPMALSAHRFLELHIFPLAPGLISSVS